MRLTHHNPVSCSEKTFHNALQLLPSFTSKESTPPNVHPTQVRMVRGPLNHLLYISAHTQWHTFARQHPSNLRPHAIQDPHRRIRHARHASLLPLARIDEIRRRVMQERLENRHQGVFIATQQRQRDLAAAPEW